MTVRRDLQQKFADSYIRSTSDTLAPTIRNATLLAHEVSTIIVDTVHLTNGAQELDTTWTLPGFSSTPLDTAYRATIHSTPPLMQGLHHASSMSENVTVQPSDSGSEDVEWAAWHHGNELELTIAGSVSAVLRYCDITENEREVITLAARRLSVGNHVVFAAAHSVAKRQNLQTGSFTFDGLISCLLHAYPGTHEAIAQLREKGKRVIYMTPEPEDIATYIGHACGVVDQPSAAQHTNFTSSTSHSIYAHANQRAASRLIRALPPSVLIARHHIGTINNMLDAFR